MAFAIVVPWALKNGLQVTRPPGSSSTNWSFPSAHTLHSTVIYGFLVVLLATPLDQDKRWPLYAFAIVLVTLIGMSRIYLGVHWFSDVLAGWVLGLLWVSVLGLAWRHHPHPAILARPLVGGIFLSLFITMTWHLNMRHEDAVKEYQPRETGVVTLSQQEWAAGAPLPLERKTLTSSEQLTLRVAGDSAAVVSRLSEEGWKKADIAGGSAIIRYLSTSTALNELPPLPKVYEGRLPVVQMTMMHGDDRLVVRLWRTSVTLGKCEVLVGYLLREEAESFLGLARIINSLQDNSISTFQEQLAGVLEDFTNEEGCY